MSSGRIISTLRFMFFLFCVITTVQLISFVFAMNLGARPEQLSMDDLQNILLIAFASTLPTLIYAVVDFDILSKFAWYFWRFFHFISTACSVFGLSYAFGWLTLSRSLTIIAIFIGVYGIAALSSNQKEMRIARQINAKLDDF